MSNQQYDSRADKSSHSANYTAKHGASIAKHGGTKKKGVCSSAQSKAMNSAKIPHASGSSLKR